MNSQTSSRGRRSHVVRRGIALATLIIGLGASGAQAHNVAADLSVWGNFGTDTARCQRAISRAAAYCVGRVVSIRGACASAQLRGETCDDAATEGKVQGARVRAAALVSRACSAPQLQNLRYVDLHDAQTDVITVCRTLDVAATTAAFNPAMLGGKVSTAAAGDQNCLAVTAAATGSLLRFAVRARQAALDEIAATAMTPDEKLARLARSQRMIDRAVQLTRPRLLSACGAAQFQQLYHRGTDDYLARIAGRADCLAQSVYVQNAITCPPPVCGDGMQVPPDEECDDGNDYDGDGCRSDCVKTDCDVFPTTYDLIQKAIFENHGCTEDACHGSAKSGGLDLRAGASYANLVDQPSGSLPDSGWKRVDPGSHDTSLLWVNLAARTLPDQYTAPLRGMPLSLAPISADELEALRIWIETGGAARQANLPQAASLLNACVPEPVPVKIDPLEPPAPGTGVQLHMPAWTLQPHSESEVCFAGYYDFTGQVPAAFLSPDGKRFHYKSVQIRQDPLSHHLIVDTFHGTEAADDPAWGPYFCRGGEHDGQSCNPLDLPACGSGQCATPPDPNTIACIGFGPTTGFGTLGSGGFAFAQETTAFFRFPTDVYNELPLKGVVLWNSHAFNLTNQSGTLEAWLNILFPDPEDQDYAEQQIFDISKIFWTDAFPPFPLPKLEAFHDMEVCQVHEFYPLGPNDFGGSNLLPGETAHLFEISGHMHQRGKRFQIFRGAFTCANGTNAGKACSPFVPEMCPAGACIDAGGRDPQAALLYTNYVYNDPVVVRFPDPLLISGSAPRGDRTLTYCAHYDNGTAPNIQAVKRRSTSPPPGVLFDIFSVGGPCDISETRCIGGPHHDELCNGTNAVCDSSGGAGDGDCDACPLTGGFRTQDEMFILFGNYWVTKD